MSSKLRHIRVLYPYPSLPESRTLLPLRGLLRNRRSRRARDRHGRGDARADAEDVLPGEVRLVAERAEDRVRAVEERERRVELDHAPCVHHQDPVVVHCLERHDHGVSLVRAHVVGR